METLRVRDLMTEKVVAVRSNEDLSTVNELMFDHHIRHLPVIDPDNQVVGIVSQRDVGAMTMEAAQYLPVFELQNLLKKTKVREVMTQRVETIDPNEWLAEAGRIMLETKLGCLPVTEGQRLVGILTESDFVRYLVEREEAQGKPKLKMKAGGKRR